MADAARPPPDAFHPPVADGPADAPFSAPSSGAGAPKKLFYPGAVFPSARLAPVNPPYYFGYQLPSKPGRQGAFNVVAQVASMFEQNRDAYLQANTVPLLHRQLFYKHLEANYRGVSHYEHYKEAAMKSHGIFIDEFLTDERGTLTPDFRDGLRALQRVRKEHPAFFVHAWLSNKTRLIPSWMIDDHEAYTLLVPEAYVYADADYMWQRLEEFISATKKSGMAEKMVIGLVGAVTNAAGQDFLPSEAFLRRQLVMIREGIPETPGLAVWVQSTLRDAFEQMVRPSLDKLIDEYFFKAAPSVNWKSPARDQKVRGTIAIEAEGLPNASTKKPVTAYRFFIDNTVVAVGSSPAYVWETSRTSAGPHTLTVHAVDSAHLVGVAQVEVEVERP